jgi:hypothetical protein
MNALPSLTTGWDATGDVLPANVGAIVVPGVNPAVTNPGTAGVGVVTATPPCTWWQNVLFGCSIANAVAGAAGQPPANLGASVASGAQDAASKAAAIANGPAAAVAQLESWLSNNAGPAIAWGLVALLLVWVGLRALVKE